MLSTAHYLESLQQVVNLRRSGFYDAAFAGIQDLVLLRPQESCVWHTLAQIHTDRGDFHRALEANEEAWRLAKIHRVVNPTHYQNIALGLAVSRMRFGQFEAAWPLWEIGRANVSWQPWPGSRYWDGEAVDKLLVQAEGGYGDTFMYLRWLPLLKKDKGVKRLGLMIWKPLETFCDWKALGVDDLYVMDRDSAPFTWKFATSIMSLPAVCGMKTWEDIPKCGVFEGGPGVESPDGVYLCGLDLRKPLEGREGRALRLGFCWRAEENTSPVRTKSLPVEVASAVVDSIRLVNIPDRAIDIFSLSPTKKDLYTDSEFVQPEQVRYEPERMTDWRATAEYICSMDFVLTVDTAAAHLCGLLGVPALLLLPVSSCWRWGMRRRFGTYINERPRWYGDQMFVYRQSKPLFWDANAIVAAAGLIEWERKLTQ